jgi:hypothetical protein
VVLAGLLVCDFLGMSAGGFAPLHHQQRPKAAFLSVTSSGRSISRTRASTPHPILSFLPGKEAGLSFRSSILLLRAESSSGSSSASSAKNASEVSHGEIRDYRNAMSISRTNGNGGGSADKVRIPVKEGELERRVLHVSAVSVEVSRWTLDDHEWLVSSTALLRMR